jgi:hypothetical protein
MEGDDGFGGHHIDGYTKLHNGSQWNEQPTNGIQLVLIYSKQSLMTSFRRIGKPNKRRIWSKYG